MYIFDNLLKKKINLKYTSIIFGIFLCLSIFCFCYYLFLHSIMHKDCSDYLEETASQIENNIKNRINDYYGLLYLISNIISTQDDGTIKDLQTIVDFNSNDLDFQQFFIN